MEPLQRLTNDDLPKVDTTVMDAVTRQMMYLIYKAEMKVLTAYLGRPVTIDDMLHSEHVDGGEDLSKIEYFLHHRGVRLGHMQATLVKAKMEVVFKPDPSVKFSPLQFLDDEQEEAALRAEQPE